MTGDSDAGELVEGGGRRLGIASLVCAAVFAAVFGVMNLAKAPAVHMALGNWVAGACVALSLAVFAATRARLSPKRLRDLGLGYEVVGSFGIALAETLATYQPDRQVRGISWVCLWIALFPLLVPSTPGRTLAVAFTSALMGWFALHAAALLGVPLPAIGIVLYLIMPNFAAAALAVLFSRLIHRLGRDAHRARQLGSYQLIEPLGHGGMGEVWRARHRMLAQPAAIKLLSAEALGGKARSERIRKRFEREARATAMLSSPSTIRIYDFGRTEDGTLYYVMELLDGIDLETLVAEHGPVSPERAIFLLRQVCDSLAEAHASGLVHRDIKPANIYVCRLGTHYDRVKVLDFGLVALREDRSGEGTRLTADDHITGTPAYMAPETVTGDHAVDHRADIYALGCVAYWLVTGELVFEGDTAVKILYGHVERAPLAPSKKTKAILPLGFDELVLDCLRKDPAARPESAAGVADRLEAIDLGDPWNQRRAAAWWEGRAVVSRLPAPSRRKPRDTVVKA